MEIKRLFLIAVWMIISVASMAQNGVIKGTITDAVTKETLVGATIYINGTTTGTMSDLDGNFSLTNVPLGNHILICSYISYDKIEKEITVKNGETIEVNFKLSGTSVSVDEVTVAGRRNPESETLLMMEQKNSLMATQTVGAQELSRKGVSDAEGAVTKISGISKQQGVKNVFVRGLGDRYNTTTLNGFILPSEDPEYKNISLDFFTNDMIQTVTVSKVFSASMNGDVGGALIDIKSKELNSDGEFNVGVSSSLNSQTAGVDIVLPDGMTGFGYSNTSDGPYNNLTDYSFTSSLDPKTVNNPYNLNMNVSGGKRFLNKHRFFVAGAMNNDNRYEQGVLREITASDAANPFMDMSYERFEKKSSIMAMGGIELNIDDLKLAYNSLYIHSGSAYHADLYGKHSELFQVADEFNSEGLVRRQQINDNSIFINQLILQGMWSERVKYNFGVSLNRITGMEPDRRIFRFPSVGGGKVQLAQAENRNERFNSEITETAIIPKFNIQYKLSKDRENRSSVEIGYDSRISNKEFSAQIYNHTWNPNVISPIFDRNNVMLDAYINQDALLLNSFNIEYFNDTYDVTRNMHGSYIDLIYQLNNSLTLNVGLRGDYVYTRINYEVNRGANIGTDTFKGVFISPSLNVKYILNDKNHLRIGASHTNTLPQDKEISPFVYQGFDGLENGNPELEISNNYNVDLKWDHYLSNNEMFSLNGFYKYILNPIARVDQGNSAGIKTFDNVSDHAIAAGVEAELRKKLLSFAQKHTINLGINASYIYSKIELDPQWFVQNTTSTLEGAAPYIFNADLTYNMVSGKFSMNSTFVVNYLSDKVHTIGTRGYNNLIEESLTTLDFVNTIKINKHLGIGFKALNLLNPDFNLTREGADGSVPSVVTRSYKKGVLFDLGITYNL